MSRVTEVDRELQQDDAPQEYRHCFLQFERHLQEALSQLSNQQDGTPTSLVRSLQQRYQTEILSLDLDTLPPPTAHTVQSIQVEMDKQLRLLAMDAQFLQAAKQPATVELRKSQMYDRLQTLLRYCALVLT